MFEICKKVVNIYNYFYHFIFDYNYYKLIIEKIIATNSNLVIEYCGCQTKFVIAKANTHILSLREFVEVVAIHKKLKIEN